MSGIYLDFHIAVPPDEHLRELIPAVLSEYPFEGFLEDDRGIHCYVQKAAWTFSIETIIRELSDSYKLSYIDVISTSEIAQTNWNEEWEKTIQPIHVSDRFIIAPSWNIPDSSSGDVIIIDPKMTFGTGYHETTRLMIRMMEQYIPPQSTVLDVGTGTGILAIAAVKLGARRALGVDIDEWSLENGMENARRNNVAHVVEIRIGSLETAANESFDIVLANIIRNTIIELLPSMLSKVVTGGTILVSGLLASDREDIEKALAGHRYRIVQAMQENDWIALAARSV